MGVLYKLLAKVLAIGLKKVVGQEVHKSLNAFLEGRQIMDSVLIANKAIHWKMMPMELCKLDILKGYKWSC